MSNVLFPKLPGLHWEVKFKDEFSNLIQKAAAPAFETRLSLGPDPVIHYECSFDFLRQPGSQAGTPSADELQTIRGFYRARRADFDSFLLNLPDMTENGADGSITGQSLSVDANNVAPLVVSWAGGYQEAIYEAAGVNGNPLATSGVLTAPVIHEVGVGVLTAGADYTIQGPGYAGAGVTYPGLAIVFASTPSGAITADFSWYYRVRFEQSQQEYDKFLALLYSAQQVQLVTTRTK